MQRWRTTLIELAVCFAVVCRISGGFNSPLTQERIFADDPPCTGGIASAKFTHWVRQNGINYGANVSFGPLSGSAPVHYSLGTPPFTPCVCPDGHKTAAGQGEASIIYMSTTHCQSEHTAN